MHNHNPLCFNFVEETERNSAHPARDVPRPCVAKDGRRVFSVDSLMPEMRGKRGLYFWHTCKLFIAAFFSQS